MKSFAIVVVCYNRINGLKLLLQSLNRANYQGRQDITLIFSIDNSGSDIVEQYANEFEWKFGNKIIRTFPERQGLKKHILQCGDYTSAYDIVVVLEDDIVVSDSFYSYAYQAAEFYWNDDNIAGISLYNFQKNWLRWSLRFEPMKSQYDNYFLRVAQSWGQVWTKKKWDNFRCWYKQNSDFVKDDTVPEYLNQWPESSWLKFHDKYCIVENKYFVYPYYSLSTNTSAAGEHAAVATSDYQVELQFSKTEFEFSLFNDNAVIYDEYLDRIGLGKYLGVEEYDLLVDLYETRKNQINKKYLLTTTQYKGIPALKQFALSFRPIEYSIINEIGGEGIYLYEISKLEDLKRKRNDFALEKYEFRTSSIRELLPYVMYLLKEKIRAKFKVK